MNLIETLTRESLPKQDRREIWDWAADCVDFGNTTAFKGRYSVDNAPWTKEFLRLAKDLRVKKVTFVGPPQESGKTVAAEVFMSWRILNNPAPMAFNCSTNVKAKQFSDTRWKRITKACPVIATRLSDNRNDETKTRVIWKDGTFLLLQGAESKANRQSDSVEVQVNDEVHLWDPGWLVEMQGRTLAYQRAGTHKIINISTGGKKGTEFHQDFKDGNQGEWSHHCPACDQLFQYKFNMRSPEGSNIHFDKSAVKVAPDGTFNFNDFDKSVYVSCPHCAHRMEYDADRLARMNLESMRRGDGYVALNASPLEGCASLHINSFAIGARPWAKILHGWIKATMGRSVFSTALLEEFIVKELAEFWETQPIIVKKKVSQGNFTRAEMRNPKFWQDEWIRIAAFDNQRGSQGDVEHRWFVVRAFSKDGRSRLVDCGRINEWSECHQRLKDLGVNEWSPELPGPWVVVDRRYKPVEVDEVCSRYRWYGMLGDDAEEFYHPKGSEYEGQRMLFSNMRGIDTGFGTKAGGQENLAAYYFMWSSQKIQDLLAALRDGKAESWETPMDLDQFCPEYSEQINSHEQKFTSTKSGDKLLWERIGHTPDHLYDCESMLVVLGLMAGVFKR